MPAFVAELPVNKVEAKKQKMFGLYADVLTYNSELAKFPVRPGTSGISFQDGLTEQQRREAIALDLLNMGEAKLALRVNLQLVSAGMEDVLPDPSVRRLEDQIVAQSERWYYLMQTRQVPDGYTCQTCRFLTGPID